jgi:chemotaxis protein methyltransferase CheR
VFTLVSIKNSEFEELTNYIHSNYGINLKQKRVLVEGRLGAVINERGFSAYSDYLESVFSDKSGKEMTDLLNKLTTNHTFFMRESEHFDYFKNSCIPNLKKYAKDRDLRIWSAGCSSGEEPYTLSMILNDEFSDDRTGWDKKILATDISLKSLETASVGQYTSDAIESLPPVWKLNYFDKNRDGDYLIKDKVKSEVIFRKFNLMEKELPFKKKFHVIFCRNVMIYFDQKTKDELVERFYEHTEPGGYLFIGHSESIDRQNTRYEYIMPAVYRKG